MKHMISRRTFLKLSGAVAGTALLASGLPRQALLAAQEMTAKDVRKVRTNCEMCSVRCPLEIKVEDGRAVFAAGNPEWSNGGALCARGGSSVSQLYDKDRVKKPLLRQGERGENKWKEVSWDEAYDYIAEKMMQIKEKQGPEAMAFSCRGGIHKAYMDALANAYGSPNTFTHESTCPFGRSVARDIVFGTNGLNIDYANVKYMITLGRNYFEGINVGHTRAVMKGIKSGMKLVSFDPRFSVTSAKAAEWYAIRPGTDLALVLAITHVIMRDELFDRAFVDAFSVGFEEVREAVRTATPDWAESKTGVAAADIERIAKELAAAKPRAVIDWGWRTGTTTEEADLRRAIINVDILLGSFEVPGGIYLNKSAGMLNKLIGKEEFPSLKGIKLPPLPKLKPRVDGAHIPGNPNQFVPKGDGVVHYIPEAVLTGKPYPILGWFVYRNNPLLSQSNVNRVREAMQKLDLLVVCDLYLSDTAHMADVVLPECSFLERDEGFNNATGATPKYTLRQKAVEPLYDTRPNWQIFKELGQRLGLGAYFPWRDIEEVRLMQLGGDRALLARAKEKGFLDFGVKPLYLRDPKSVAAFCAKYPGALAHVEADGTIPGPLRSLSTPSKKMEMRSAAVEALYPGRGVPQYREVELKKSDELYFLQGKVAVHTDAHTHNVPYLHELMPENRLWMHPAAAAARGLKDGDTVEVTSAYGKEPAKLLLSRGIREDTVFTYFGFGRKAPGMTRANGKGTNSNVLLKNSFAPVCAMSLHTAGVTVAKK